jgi:DNA-binding LacI/PurR family transcriptional regulator
LQLPHLFTSRDIALASFDDAPCARTLDMTSVNMGFNHLGYAAVSALANPDSLRWDAYNRMIVQGSLRISASSRFPHPDNRG